MASSSSFSSHVKDKDYVPRNWAELPSELTYSIMLRLNMVDILHSAQRVCTSWRHVSKDPSLWRKIDMTVLENYTFVDNDYSSIVRLAVDRSEGCLVEINLGWFGNDTLLNYVAGRSSNLRRLTLVMFYSMSMVTNEGLVKAVAKLPMLEEFEVFPSGLKPDLKAIGHSCPRLKTFKLNGLGYMGSYSESDDDDALAIAESMAGLRHLELRGNKLTDAGLTAILDNCPHLEHLDLTDCLRVKLVGNLEKRCSEMIKDFRRPEVVYSDYEDDYDIYGFDDFEEEYDLHR